MSFYYAYYFEKRRAIIINNHLNESIITKLKSLNISVLKDEQNKDNFVAYYDLDEDKFFITTAVCILTDNIKEVFHVINKYNQIGFVRKNQLIKYFSYDIHGLNDYLERYPNCCLQQFIEESKANDYINSSSIILKYLVLYMYHPQVEQLVKAGFSKLLVSELSKNIFPSDFERLFKNGSDIKSITELDNSYWRLLIKHIDDFSSWSIYKTIIKEHNATINQLNRLIKLNATSFRDLFCIEMMLSETYNDKNVYTVESLISYLESCITKQKLKLNEAVNLLSDYNYMCLDVGLMPYIKPDNLKLYHDIMSERYEDEKQKQEEKKQIERQIAFDKQASRLQKYLYEDNDLLVVIPKTVEDVYNEAHNQHNCVASYIEKHAKHKTNILFIREKNKPNDSYITVELDDNNQLIKQARYKYNREITKERDIKFIDNWLKYCFG